MSEGSQGIPTPKGTLKIVDTMQISLGALQADMNRFSLPLTRLVHENLSIVMCFAYSQTPLAEMVERKFRGGWKYLHKALFEISEERAEKACIELALFLRMLDDEDEISAYLTATQNVPNCGTLFRKDGKEEVLTFREVANKVLHASRLGWEFSKRPEPLLVCYTRDEEKWLRAEVDIVAVASVCGMLMS